MKIDGWMDSLLCGFKKMPCLCSLQTFNVAVLVACFTNIYEKSEAYGTAQDLQKKCIGAKCTNEQKVRHFEFFIQIWPHF